MIELDLLRKLLNVVVTGTVREYFEVDQEKAYNIAFYVAKKLNMIDQEVSAPEWLPAREIDLLIKVLDEYCRAVKRKKLSDVLEEEFDLIHMGLVIYLLAKSLRERLPPLVVRHKLLSMPSGFSVALGFIFPTIRNLEDDLTLLYTALYVTAHGQS